MRSKVLPGSLVAQNLTYQAPLIEGTFEAGIPEKEKTQNRRIVGPKNGISDSGLSDPYTFALAAMPLLDDRIKFSSFTTTTGQPIESLREWLRAVEMGEWPTSEQSRIEYLESNYDNLDWTSQAELEDIKG